MKVIYDEVFLKHRPPRGHDHPECPERVSTARAELETLEVHSLPSGISCVCACFLGSVGAFVALQGNESPQPEIPGGGRR